MPIEAKQIDLRVLKTIQGPTIADLTGKHDLVRPIADEESLEQWEGRYGHEQWDWNGDCIGIDWNDIKGDLYLYEDHHYLIVTGDLSNDPVNAWRIDTIDQEVARDIASDLFQDECQIYGADQ